MNHEMLRSIRLQDPVFAPRQKKGRDATIPGRLEALEKTGCLKAFKLQWKKGDPDMPHIFWDSDVAKVMEGMAEMLMIHPDPAMEKQLDELVDLVISAQQEDGYLNTHFTVVEPEKRWTCLGGAHELYCAGHLMEAAVAHFEATGERKFLDAMCRYADYIASVFGREPGQKRGYPGHEEIELALVKLYRATGEKRYLDLAKYFIDERGSSPNYFVEKEKLSEASLQYVQAHLPVREQKDAVGHAVRAVYLYCGMVDVAAETHDAELLNAAIRLFNSITQRKMYLTGGIGGTAFGEAFCGDFELPNDTAYAESCAAVGLALFAKRLLDVTGEAKYADIMEQVIYNNGLSGIALDGDHCFYVNPMEINHRTLLRGGTIRERVKTFGCSCCVTTYCRFLPQLGMFCVKASPDHLRIDIPAAAVISTKEYEAEITGGYPYDGTITLKIRRGGAFTLSMRIPGWCNGIYSVKCNGASAGNIGNGYWTEKRVWKEGDTVTLSLHMIPELVYAHPLVSADACKAAIRRGPLVYCFESVDNPAFPVQTAILPADPEFRLGKPKGLPEGTVAVVCKAKAAYAENETLYGNTPPRYKNVELCAIPYALWQNRGTSEMQVFLPVR